MELLSCVALRHLSKRGQEKGVIMTVDPEQKCCVQRAICYAYATQCNEMECSVKQCNKLFMQWHWAYLAQKCLQGKFLKSLGLYVLP